MADTIQLAIISALEREIRPLVKDWTVTMTEHAGHRFKIFENDGVILVCGGIGVEAARRATEAIISMCHPELVLSVGFAGALDSTLHVGDIFVPALVIDAKDGSNTEITSGEGKLVTISGVADVSQKSKLAQSYSAQAADMEAAGVARCALSHGVPFMAVKSISDEHDFKFPSLDRFIAHNGQFRTARFAAYASIRPWLWGRTIEMGKSSARAANTLCQWLYEFIRDPKKLDNLGLHPHPTEVTPT